jgi:hypothetical protein
MDKYVTRKADIKRLEGFKQELANKAPKTQEDTLSNQNRSITDGINF